MSVFKRVAEEENKQASPLTHVDANNSQAASGSRSTLTIGSGRSNPLGSCTPTPPKPVALNASELSDEMKQKFLKQVALQKQMESQPPSSATLKRPMPRTFASPTRESDKFAPPAKRVSSPVAQLNPSETQSATIEAPSSAPALPQATATPSHPPLPAGPLQRATSTGAKLPALPFLVARNTSSPIRPPNQPSQ